MRFLEFIDLPVFIVYLLILLVLVVYKLTHSKSIVASFTMLAGLISLLFIIGQSMSTSLLYDDASRSVHVEQTVLQTVNGAQIASLKSEKGKTFHVPVSYRGGRVSGLNGPATSYTIERYVSKHPMPLFKEEVTVMSLRDDDGNTFRTFTSYNKPHKVFWLF